MHCVPCWITSKNAKRFLGEDQARMPGAVNLFNTVQMKFDDRAMNTTHRSFVMRMERVKNSVLANFDDNRRAEGC